MPSYPKSTKFKPVNIATLMFLLGTIFPMLAANIKIPLMYPSFAALLLLTISHKPKILTSRPLIFAFIYFIVLLIYNYFEFTYVTFESIIMMVLPLIASIILLEYYILNKDNNDIRFIYKVFIIIIAIRCISAIIVELIFPGTARKFEGISSGEALTDQMFRLGAGGYAFINALPFIIMPLMYIFKKSNVKSTKILISLLIGIIFYAIFVTSWGAALVFALITIVIGLSANNRRSLINSTIVLAILTGVFFMFIDDFFTILNNVFKGNEVFLLKISDIQESFKYKQSIGQIEIRGNLYSQSIDLFLEHPFFGSDKESGGHAYFIDHLANYGIFGMSFLLIIIYSTYKNALKLMPKNYKLFYSFTILLYIGFGCVKNIVGFEFSLFIFLFTPFIINSKYL